MVEIAGRLEMGGGPVSPGRREEVVLITGCSDGGIGSALAPAFCDAGFIVVATSRSLESMKSIRDHQHVEALVLDVTVEESMKEAVEKVMTMYGRIDILVNNAGMPCPAPLVETPMSIMEKVYKTNVFGPIMLIQMVVPHMVACGKGKIVNVGSIGAYAASPWSGTYSATKAALHAATDVLRMELRPFGIDVILVVPGSIVSGIGKTGATVLDSYVQSLDIYKPFVPFLVKRAASSQSPKSTPTDEFAVKTVQTIVSKEPPAYFTYGYRSRVYRALYHCPAWVRDWWFSEKVPSVIPDKKHD